MIARIRQLSSVLTTRSSLARQAGLTFAGDRDLYASLGYSEVVDSSALRARYLRSEVAARIVEVYPKDTWRGGSEVIDTEELENETPFMKAWKELSTRLRIWPMFERVDILAGLGRYSVLLIGAPGDSETPIGRISSPDRIAYVTPFAECDARIDDSSIVQDETSPRCGLPEFYKITRLRGKRGFERRYHHSRVLHYADGLLDDPLFAQSIRMLRVWNRLDDLEKVVGAGSESFWMRAHQGYVVEFDKDAEIEQEQIDSAREQAEEFAHQQSRTIGLQGAEFKALGSDVADFKNQVDSIMTLIAGGTGIPKRMLLGSEQGELASTQDRALWERRINDRRLELAEPLMIRPFVDRLIAWGALPEPKDGTYTVRWPSVDLHDAVERIDMARKVALINGAMKQVTVAPDEIRTRILGWPTLEEAGYDDLENPYELPRPLDSDPDVRRQDEPPERRPQTKERSRPIRRTGT